MLVISSLLVYGTRILEYAKGDIAQAKEFRTVSGKVALMSIFITAVLFLNFLRVNLSFQEWRTAGEMLWSSFPLGGWMLIFAGFGLLVWILANVALFLGIEKEIYQSERRTLFNIVVIIIDIMFFLVIIKYIVNWTNAGQELLPSFPIIGWLLIAVWIWSIVWVLMRVYKNKTKEEEE